MKEPNKLMFFNERSREICYFTSRFFEGRGAEPHGFSFVLLCLAILLISVTARPSSAELPPNSRYVRAAVADSLTSSGTANFLAIVSEHEDKSVPADVWVPYDLLRSVNIPITLNASKRSFRLRVNTRALGVPIIDSLAPSGAMDLDFRAMSEDMTPYFNLTGMELATGLSYTMNDDDVLIVGESMTPPALNDPKLPELRHPFNLVWDHVFGANPDLSAEAKLPIGVISPTWFALFDESGRVSNLGGVSYTIAAHAKGYRVWALASNGFKRTMTQKFLASKAAQDRFIASVLVYSKIYGVDGINIDFEGLANEDARSLTNFVRRFVGAGRAMGLAFSMDVMIPSQWHMSYERRSLSEIVDYIAVMTYDEHWRTSKKAGSTASLPWVSEKLALTLMEVPPEKLLLGVPFYTREWGETKLKNGSVRVKSLRALSMASADERAAASPSNKKWLPEAGQNYFQTTSGNLTRKIWIEDEKSIGLRMRLVKRNNLAGAAFWRKGFERPEIWRVIEDALR
jgi:spore germination protein YaaH